MDDYSIAQQSHQGGRDYNEDRTAIFERDNALLLVVADGLGGHEGGHLASQAFVDALGSSFSKATAEQLREADSFLTLSINYAHHMIHRRAVEQGFAVESPKTTCVVCLVYDGVAQWAHSGDSRLYLIRKQEIAHRTEDHVSTRRGNGGNNPINRCVGGLEPPKPELSERHELEHGDIIMLSSDGAWFSFQTEDLREYVDNEHPTLGLDSLLQELENRNKTPSDNLSVVVAFWGVKQLDKASVDEIPLQNASAERGNAPDQTTQASQFDMKDLDNAINDIEEFISELDKQL